MNAATVDCDKLSLATSAHPCRLFSLAEIQSATKDFDDELVIGHGGFGRVYKGLITSENIDHVVAIKRLDSMSTQGAPEFKAEIEILSKLRHCNLVSLIGYCDDSREMILVYEYMPNGTLYHRLHKSDTPLNWVQRMKIAIGGARGLDYLHTGVGSQHGIIHRDVKSSNILLDENWTALISDFGLSKIGPTNQTVSYVAASVKGTFGYLDPEYVYSAQLTRKTDVFSFGVVLFELLSGRLAVDASRGEEQCSLVRWARKCVKERKIEQIVDSNIKGTIFPKVLRKFALIADRCVHSVTKERPTMSEVVASLHALLKLQQKYDSSANSGSMGFNWKIQKYLVSTTKQNSGFSYTVSFESYVKISLTAHGKKKDSIVVIVAIVIATMFVILSLVFIGVRWYKKKKTDPVKKLDDESSEEDNFWESLSGMPIRFSYIDLQVATENFSKKLGQGGFWSVYEGILKDGTRIAVKQLEGIGQGKREFRAEVIIIGGIHHHHLVELKGFCADGLHWLLVYEYMGNGSLDRWIFKKKKTEFLLDWDTRYNIAVGTAKGLAYLHEDCDVKIVHCDIKPENVQLDANFRAKVSDFGLAKLMTREQTHVFTTLRGTRGYLAPEWITGYAISEKSDVYSFGMVLLEIIGGRKNYEFSMISEKSHFPSYAFKMMEEGNIHEILDQQMKIDEKDQRVIVAIQVALWCIQDDMNLRPPMTKVVQMLEGLCPVPAPPMEYQTRSRISSGLFKSVSEEGTSSGPSDCNSDTYLSAVRLSGPR